MAKYVLNPFTGQFDITEDLSGYVPYTGATQNLNLGANNLTVDTNTFYVDSVNHRVGIGTASPTSTFDIGVYRKIWAVSSSIANSAGDGAYANLGYFNIGTYYPFNMEIILVSSGTGGGAHRYILSMNYNNKQDDSTWRILTPINTLGWANSNITYLEVKNTSTKLWFRIRRAKNAQYDHTYKITFIVHHYLDTLTFTEDTATGTDTSSLETSLLSGPILMSHNYQRVGIGVLVPQEKLTLASDSNFVVEMAVPTGVTATTAAGGTLNGTYYYKISASDGNTGWTKVSSEVSGTVDGGITYGTINVSWTAVTGATKYRVWRGTSSGGENQYYETTSTSISDNGSLTFNSATPPTYTTAYINKITASGNSWFLGGNVGIGKVTPNYKCHISGTLGFNPGTSVTPANNGDVVIEATNNTTLTFKLKGSDGTVRSATLTLA